MTEFQFVYGENVGAVHARNVTHATRIVRETYGGTGDVLLFTVIAD